LSQLSQTQTDNPFRPGSGIFPPLLAGRERETAIAMARVARTREGHPHHTALLGEWAIGKTTLLMHWRRLLRGVGDVAVLSLAYPQPVGEFFDGLRLAIDADGGAADVSRDVELGVDLGLATAKLRQTNRVGRQGLRGSLERLAKRQQDDRQLACVLIDDIDLLPDGRQALLQLRAISLELYANDLPIALVVAASPTLFAGIGSAHESLVRYYEPLTLGPLEPRDAELAVSIPLRGSGVTFDQQVLADIASASAGRPYYIQKLAYYAFDAAVNGRVGLVEYRLGFERAFAAVSQEIFAARWNAMSPSERAVVRLLADGDEPRRSGEIEGLARLVGIAPPATRQALRRLASRGHVARLANGRRGRYTVEDPLFRRYLAMAAA
jgi:hypothetical protein